MKKNIEIPTQEITTEDTIPAPIRVQGPIPDGKIRQNLDIQIIEIQNIGKKKGIMTTTIITIIIGGINIAKDIIGIGITLVEEVEIGKKKKKKNR